MPSATRVIAALRDTGATVAAAESLTGGLASTALTSVPGASAVVRGGIVAYHPQVKHEALGVPQEVIDRHGVISAECAAAMATGVRGRLGADWGVATTGVAGPDASEGHPPGTVYVACAGREQPVTVLVLHLHGSREEIREATVSAALEMLENAVTASLSGG